MESQIRVITPITTKAKDDVLTITGIASTTNKDLQNEIISKTCLESMNKQVVGLNLHLDHNHSYDGVIGVIIESKISKNNELYITANILPEFAEDIRQKLEFGLSMGLSIGGIPERNKTNPKIIDDIKLLEVSLTPLPANNDSRGSVEIVKGVITSNCFGKACHYFLKNLETNNMVNKEEKPETEEVAVEKAAEEKPEQEEEKTGITQEDAVALFNELMAEKEEVIIEELSKKMENKIQTIVASILEQSKPEQEEEEEEIVEEKEEGEPKENGSSIEENNEEPEQEEEAGEVAKTLPDLEETSRTSKLDNIITEKSQNNTFLNSEHRDIFGRNKKYL